MKFITGAEVYSSGNEKVGTVDRVVLDPETDEVTHLVVSKGFLFTTDRVIPIEWIKEATEERIILTKSEDAFKDLPEYKETLFLPIDRRDSQDLYARGVYWYPPVAYGGQLGVGYNQFVPHFLEKTKKNIPTGNIALEQGAKVYSRDEEHIGNVESVIINEEDNITSHLVVKEGLFQKTRTLIPAYWIKQIKEDEIHLSVKADVFENMPEYTQEEER